MLWGELCHILVDFQADNALSEEPIAYIFKV